MEVFVVKFVCILVLLLYNLYRSLEKKYKNNNNTKFFDVMIMVIIINCFETVVGIEFEKQHFNVIEV